MKCFTQYLIFVLTLIIVLLIAGSMIGLICYQLGTLCFQ